MRHRWVPSFLIGWPTWFGNRKASGLRGIPGDLAYLRDSTLQARQLRRLSRSQRTNAHPTSSGETTQAPRKPARLKRRHTGHDAYGGSGIRGVRCECGAARRGLFQQRWEAVHADDGQPPVHDDQWPPWRNRLRPPDWSVCPAAHRAFGRETRHVPVELSIGARRKVNSFRRESTQPTARTNDGGEGADLRIRR